jgi:hypothetical protein
MQFYLANLTKLMRKIIFFLLLSFCVALDQANAQQITQTIRGRLTDAQSKAPLIGANVIITTTDPIIGASTDFDGYFKLEKVPLGRHHLKATYLGYREQQIPNLLVNSGKELIINLEMEEMVIMGEEIVIIAERDKGAVNNELATVSARSFNVEETGRYAGSRNDPARMAANFAGVSGANDARNDIIIRGNSPFGLLWRLEGIDIPSPNHFSSLGSTGGPVSMLNNNVLDKSDFMTAAFPATYGNALAGVFDLQMRHGNNEKREYLGQIGFNGFEFGAEGPFSKKSRASYLINYRYSTLGVFKAMGVDFGTGAAVPDYQDISFKVDIPTNKAGRFAFFGVGGISDISLLGSEADPSKTDLYGNYTQDIINKNNMGVLGFSHTYFYNKNTCSKITLAASSSSNITKVDSLDRSNDAINPMPYFRLDFTTRKYSANILVNKKFNARNTLTSGIIADLYDIRLVDSVNLRGRFYTQRNTAGVSLLSQAYSQLQHRFSNELTLNTGLHYQHYQLNNSSALEPRTGLRYQFRPSQSLNAGYGLHSQMQALTTYFTETELPSGETIKTNKNLGFTRSHHWVIGYDNALSKDWRIKAETYYQYITGGAVSQRYPSFSMLNFGADFEVPWVDSLLNSGTGRNYGVELTVEKFYSNNYYFLATTSLFSSKYRGHDGALRNTPFNGRYVVNLLFGKEFHIGNKSNVLAIDWKLTAAGGRYITPILLDESINQRRTVLDHTNAFSEQVNDYFRADIKVSFRKNMKRLTHEWALDVSNVFNTKNVFNKIYDPVSEAIVTNYQLGIFPVPQYRILF